MNLPVIKELAYNYMSNNKAHRDCETGFIYYHGERVGNLSIALRKELFPANESDDDIIIAASYFHDIAKGIEPHGKYSSILIGDILKDYCDNYELKKIVEIIKYHQVRVKDNNYPDYVKLVQDADFIDHYGTVGIGINFYQALYSDINMKDLVVRFQNEFEKNSERKRELLNYELSKKVYNKRVEFTKAFVDRFSVEVDGGIYSSDY